MTKFRRIFGVRRRRRQVIAAGARNTMAFPLTAFLLFLAIVPQMVHAQDFCGLLDRVVAAAEENPPFDSVRHLDAPKATSCSAGKYGWGCAWEDSRLNQAWNDYSDLHSENDPQILDGSKTLVEFEIDEIKKKLYVLQHGDNIDFMFGGYSNLEEARGALERYRYEKNRRKLKSSSHSYFKDVEASLKKLEKEEARLEAKRAQLEANLDRLHRLPEELDKLEKKVRQMTIDILQSQIQTLLSGIRQCFSKNAIRGSWSSFAISENEFSKEWITFQDSNPNIYLSLMLDGMGPDFVSTVTTPYISLNIGKE